MTQEEANMRNVKLVLGILIVAPLLAAAIVFAAPAGTATSAPAVPPEVLRWGFIAAAVVAGLGAIGAAYAVAVVGAAAMGVIAEKPDMAGRALIFVGLAEGIAIYGLIIAIMILGRLG